MENDIEKIDKLDKVLGDLNFVISEIMNNGERPDKSLLRIRNILTEELERLRNGEQTQIRQQKTGKITGKTSKERSQETEKRSSQIG